MEYEIEGFDDADLEVARLTRRYDRRDEKTVINQYKRRKGLAYDEKMARQMAMELKPYNGMSLSYKDAYEQAKEIFMKSTVLHFSYLVELNAELAPKLYRYFVEHYSCEEIRKGTLKLIKV